ncbi:type I polyketide synthase, partial [Actinomadura geliboluensis]|uniref:type I polyketide synthase n=1 Tax=Actinomadura geliboluensis TaxID=882440 RepID=UPI0036C4938F
MADLRRDEPVAVIGMSCRLPRAAGVGEFWELLRDGGQAVSRVPDGRWPAGAFDRAGLTDEELRCVRWGAFLDDAEGFDAAFFGISPREAAVMDPQQRLMLELAWEAFEDAGAVPGRRDGDRTGVFVGVAATDHAVLLDRHGPAGRTSHAVPGVQHGIIANRVSYALGLRGPSLSVDTGQSSSLVAVHTACESLRRGESSLALAGGVNLNLLPEAAFAVARFGALSPDGRCHTFDARANGYVRGEGGGAVLLKPLARALADGDRVHCVIRGSAVNNDGGGSGLTVPRGEAQEEVIRLACARAAVDPGDLQYVELHGTGTRVGDPVEAAALGTVVGAAREPDLPLVVGSAKTNIGHLEAAAGIVGLLKTALCLRNGEHVRSLNFETPHPEIPLDELNLAVSTENAAWPAPAVAGVSSFGMGGTNCHVIVSGPEPSPEAPRDTAGGRRPVPLPVSGRSATALAAQARRLHDFLSADETASLTDVGWSLATTRAEHRHRGVVVARERAEALAGLEALAAGEPAAHVTTGVARTARVGVVFSGQGAQRARMGLELHRTFPVFARCFDEVCGLLDERLSGHVPHPVADVVFAAPGDERSRWLDETVYTQAGLFAFEVALFRVLEAFGLEPDVVAGHSIGEVTAAHVAGVLTLEDAAALVAARGRLMQDLPAGGGMLAVEAAEGDLAGVLSGGAAIAAVNGPAATVVSGDLASIDRIEAAMRDRGVKTRRLRVSHAFHSPLMDPLLTPFAEAIGGLEFHPPRLPLISNVTGREADAGTVCDPDYWVRHVRAPVRFADAVSWMEDEGVGMCVEVGPSGVLTGMAQGCLTDPDAMALIAASRSKGPEAEAMWNALARAHTCGAPLAWDAVFEGGRRVDLPTYAFQRRTYRLGETGADDSEPASAPAHHREFDGLSENQRMRRALRLVNASAAAVLGHGSAGDVDPSSSWRDLGFDSLMSVELRNRLAATANLPLPASVLFDFPTPLALAEHLRTRMLESAPGSDAGERAPVAPDEPIAIVAMACRYPGGAGSPEDLWRLVRDGVDAISEFPADRGWDVAAPSGADRPGDGRGGFLHDAGDFDPGAFGISPREALAMDPQQRLLLETAWEVLERAGIPPLSLSGSPTGVFIGAVEQEYGGRLHEASEESGGFLLTGTTNSVASGRLAFTFGFGGAAMTVDTACSSSLVALHLAVQSLRNGECSLALAGGVTVMATPGMFLEFGRQGGLAPDGRCKAFSAAADGTGWAEGVGVLLVERLSDARRNGHEVLAVVRGSAVNQDGASNGLTAPNGPSQQRVIRQALANAGLSASDVDAVEAHGTGTTLGDPIEAQALIATYGHDRDPERPLRLGSIKSNIGHAQAAAGVAGVIKMVMAMRNGMLPRTLHVDEPSPHIDWSQGAVELLTEPVSWETGDRPRRAGVSSFGISGTNAHVILEQAPVQEEPGDDVPEAAAPEGAVPLVVSGRSPAALAAQAARLRDFLSAEHAPSLPSVGWSLATTRASLEHRGVVLARDRGDALAGLDALAEGLPAARAAVGKAGRGPVVMVFPGQGSQWAGMGRELLDASPVFAEAIGECEAALAPHVDWSPTELLRGAAMPERVDIVQPALFAVMVALARLWESAGVVPDVVIGHSQGEIAAAHIAGALSLEDAAKIIALRSSALRELSGHGAMAQIALDEHGARELLHPWDGRVSVAALNGPTTTVVSGETAAVEQVLARAQTEGIWARRVNVDYASHSHHVETIRDRLLDDLAGITPRPAPIAFHSTVTGEPADTTALDADYWYRNLREPVRFTDAVSALADQGAGTFIESSPHPVLTAGIEETCATAGDAGGVTETLRRGDGGLDRFLLSAAQAHAFGAALAWDGLIPGPRRRVALPTYAFQRRRYWMEQRIGPPRADVQTVPDVRTEQSDHDGGALRRRLAGRPETEQLRTTLKLVRAHAAAILGHESPEDVGPSSSFRDLGFESMTAVRLCDRLAAACGLPLPRTLIYDFPTPLSVARHLRAAALGLDTAAGRSPGQRGGSDEPIAIVGMACRFPGGVASPEDLWRLLTEERTAVSGLPSDRGWDLDALYDPELARPGTSYVRHGAFVDDATRFDADLFNVSPREALAMDPQQRLLLETAWEAFERGGLSPHSLTGTPTGVFVGTLGQEYGARLRDVPEEYEGFLLTGNAASVASGRMAYLFGLEGPAVTVDTACSSSLVALHLAVQSLRNGECSLALAGGVTVMATPGTFVEFSRQRALSPDGRCKSFSSLADGFGVGEGVGVLLVERLSDAVRNGREVLAVVRGSAVNQDGASNGLTAPNGPSQQRVIRQALASAGLSASDVDAVEAHGTGTTLGDPIEAQALIATYGQDRDPERPLWLGSVKSNIGHAQAAAGVAGVIKMVMAMRNGVLPRTLHVDEPSPHIDWSQGAVELLTEPVSWDGAGRARRAGVSSFGMSGTNAHVVLEQAPETEVVERATGDVPGGVVPLPVSGRSADALAAQAVRLRDFLIEKDDADLADVGRSLATGRAHLDHRGVVLARDREDALNGLAALAAGEPASNTLTGTTGPEPVVMVFPGQGSQWAGMGRELLDSSPVFAEAVGECEAALAPHVDWSLVGVLRGGSVPERVDVVQPVLFAVMVGLARLWSAAGVVPDVVVGHSQGEIAAAHVAGALSLEDAAKVVALRSRALLELSGGGAMAQLALDEDRARRLLGPLGDRVWVAAVNGPAATVVSGDPTAVEEVLDRAREEGVWARHIPVDYASHSPQVEAIRERLLTELADITPETGHIAFHSTVTGEPVDTTGLDAGYWYRNLREPVRFAEVVSGLVEQGVGVFVEVSAHPVLAAGIQDCGEAVRVVETLRRGDGGLGRFWASAAAAHVHGVVVDWAGLFGAGVSRVGLPTYAFQRRRFWLASGSGGAGDVGVLGLGGVGHPLLGAAVEVAGGDEWLLTGRLSVAGQSWLADHRVGGVVVVPGAAVLEMVVRAGDQVGCDLVEELTLNAPLVLGEREAVRVQLRVGAPDAEGRREVTVHSRNNADDASWRVHAVATVAPAGPQPAGHGMGLDAWPPANATPVPIEGFYERLARIGYAYGPAFQGLRAAWRASDGLFAEVALPEEERPEASRFAIHPALLDAAIQTCLLDATGENEEEERLRLAFAFHDVRLFASGATAVRVRLTELGDQKLRVELADATGRPVASVESMTSRPLTGEALRSMESGPEEPLLALRWIEIPTEPGGSLTDADVWRPDVAQDATETLAATLEVLRARLDDRECPSATLMIVTCGAVSVFEGEDVADVGAAGVWGLVRSAQA